MCKKLFNVLWAGGVNNDIIIHDRKFHYLKKKQKKNQTKNTKY